MTVKRFTLDFDDPRAVWIDDNSNDECYTVINDTLKKKNIQEIVDLLNELDEKWIDEFSLRETLQLELQRVEEENEQLKQRNDFLREQLDRVCIDNETMGDKLKQIGRIL